MEEDDRNTADEVKLTVATLIKKRQVETHCFYFMHVNYYCRTQEGVFVPCEVALCEFSFNRGVSSVYHTLVDPGGIPLGYTYDCQKHSEETHRIPLPPLSQYPSEKIYSNIFHRVVEILKRGKNEGKLPPIYCLRGDMILDSVEHFLRNLCENECIPYHTFTVYDLHFLLYELGNAAAQSKNKLKPFPFENSAENELNKSEYDYAGGVSCRFHETTDAMQFCSLTVVHRWAFVLAQRCCQYLGINRVPGLHLPSAQNISSIPAPPSNRESEKQKKIPDRVPGFQLPAASPSNSEIEKPKKRSDGLPVTYPPASQNEYSASVSPSNSESEKSKKRSDWVPEVHLPAAQSLSTTRSNRESDEPKKKSYRVPGFHLPAAFSVSASPSNSESEKPKNRSDGVPDLHVHAAQSLSMTRSNREIEEPRKRSDRMPGFQMSAASSVSASPSNSESEKPKKRSIPKVPLYVPKHRRESEKMKDSNNLQPPAGRDTKSNQLHQHLCIGSFQSILLARTFDPCRHQGGSGDHSYLPPAAFVERLELFLRRQHVEHVLKRCGSHCQIVLDESRDNVEAWKPIPTEAYRNESSSTNHTFFMGKPHMHSNIQSTKELSKNELGYQVDTLVKTSEPQTTAEHTVDTPISDTTILSGKLHSNSTEDPPKDRRVDDLKNTTEIISELESLSTTDDDKPLLDETHRSFDLSAKETSRLPHARGIPLRKCLESRRPRGLGDFAKSCGAESNITPAPVEELVKNTPVDTSRSPIEKPSNGVTPAANPPLRRPRIELLQPSSDKNTESDGSSSSSSENLLVLARGLRDDHTVRAPKSSSSAIKFSKPKT